MGSYHGASTLMPRSWMGRSEEIPVTAVAMVGPNGFSDASEFRRYCDLVERMRSYSVNYEAAKVDPAILERLQDFIVTTLLEVNKIERGRNCEIFAAIKANLRWPSAFVREMMEPAAAPAAPAA